MTIVKCYNKRNQIHFHNEPERSVFKNCKKVKLYLKNDLSFVC